MRVHFLSVLVATLMPSVYGVTITPYPKSVSVGEDVTFVVAGIVGAIRALNWYKGPDASAPNQFLRMNAAGEISTGALKIDRATLLPNGSLQIQNVQETDAGHYIVRVQADELLQAQLDFVVQVPDGLSTGAIAGIVTGVIVASIVVIGSGAYLYKNRDASDIKEKYQEIPYFEIDSLNK